MRDGRSRSSVITDRCGQSMIALTKLAIFSLPTANLARSSNLAQLAEFSLPTANLAQLAEFSLPTANLARSSNLAQLAEFSLRLRKFSCGFATNLPR